MKPSAVRILLAAAIKTQTPILLTGAPGIGKTDLLTLAAQDARARLIMSHPSVSDPTDVKGQPWVIGNRATFLPFGELREAMEATEPTVWFWDDLGQATPAVQAAHMQLLRARRVNGHALPDCVTIFAATNRRQDKAGVAGMLEPIKSRFCSIIELQADLLEWCEWALDNNLPAELIAYLRFQPEAFENFVPSADLTNSPSPRTWSHVARIQAMGLPAPIQAEAICGAVGSGAGTGYNGFLKMYNELPSVDGILLNPKTAPIPDSPASRYAISGALAMRANKTTFQAVVTYSQRLLDAGHGEFGVLTIRDAVRRNPECEHTPAFVKMTIGELGKLYTGQTARVN